MTTQGSGSNFFGMAFSVFVVASILYFTYAAIQGDYGIFRKAEIEAQEIKLTQQHALLMAQRQEMENRTRRLSSEYLDLDLLDEQARKILGLARGDEIIIR